MKRVEKIGGGEHMTRKQEKKKEKKRKENLVFLAENEGKGIAQLMEMHVNQYTTIGTEIAVRSKRTQEREAKKRREMPSKS